MAHMVVARVSSAPCKAPGSRRSAVRPKAKLNEADLRQTVAIVGAGIAGLASAVSLERQGYQCLVLERSEDRREERHRDRAMEECLAGSGLPWGGR